MALRRLKRDEAYTFMLASPLAFDDWENPTVDELNANPTNDPSGLIFTLTCVLNVDGTTFSLDDPELDESISFCQSAGSSERMSENPNIVFEFFRSRVPWTNAASTLASDGFNSANLALSLLAYQDVEYFGILRVGPEQDSPFAEGDRIKMAEVSTDYGVDVFASGENVRMSQDFANRSRVLWNYSLTA